LNAKFQNQAKSSGVKLEWDLVQSRKSEKSFFFLFLFEAFTFALHPRLSWPAINCHRCVFSFSVFECNSEKETYFVLENRPRMHSECFAKSKFYF
jgi:hypothetical protein